MPRCYISYNIKIIRIYFFRLFILNVCWNISSNYFILKFLSDFMYSEVVASIASILQELQYHFLVNNYGGRSWNALRETCRGIIFKSFHISHVCCLKVKKDLSRVSYNIAYDRYQLISPVSNCHQIYSHIFLVEVQRKWLWRTSVRFVSTFFSTLTYLCQVCMDIF